MRRKRRGFSAFSLSFLDIMSCGFGAVVLLFLIIKHHADVKDVMPTYDLSQEVELLEEDIGEAREKLGNARSQAATLEAELATARGEADRVRQLLADARAGAKGDAQSVSSVEIDKLKSELKRLEQQKNALQAQVNAKSNQVRTFTGEGNREYLTGLNLGGRRILILLDASASMLDDTIVNIIRRRNMDDAAKRRSWKWQQALATVDWISARLPAASEYQIFTFNTGVDPALKETRWRWLKVSNFDELNRSIEELKRVIPSGGSSLAAALASINRLSPKPDNIYLITDGLPTQGLAPPRGTTITGAQRARLFEDAMSLLPRGIPINTILLPMEGDPLAAWAYWNVALLTRGAFLTPGEGLAVSLHRRDNEPISIAFLDVITCGFGAIILLLMIARFGEPPAEDVVDPRAAQISNMQRDLFDMRRDVAAAEQEQVSLETQIATWASETRRMQQALAALQSNQTEKKDQAAMNAIIAGELKTAQQELTEEMRRLLAQRDRKSNDLIGGVPVDSEYIIFIIDTSGSMFRYAWPKVVEQIVETLEVYPRVKGIQIMNDMGSYMFTTYSGQWIPDTPGRRRAVIERLMQWNAFSNSSPVEGIMAAIRTFYSPDKKISLFVYGDEFTGRSIREVVDFVGTVNQRDASGAPRVRIHAIGFPVQAANPPHLQTTGIRFASLMRELTRRNGGTFVGLNAFR